MTDQDERLKLAQFATDCLLLRKSLVLGTTTLTPLNFEEEKEKFFQSKTYNPIFHYRQFNFIEIDKDLKILNDRLQTLSLPKDIRQYLKSYLKNLKLLERTISSIGTEEFWYHAKRLFEFDLIHADKIITTLPPVSFQNENHTYLYSAPEIAEIFRTIFSDTYNLPDVTVRIDHFADHIIRAGRRGITIGAKVKRFDTNVKRLVAHEIESHVLQHYNMDLLHNPLVKLVNFNEGLLYGEGIAVYNEIKSGTITKKSYEDYYFRLKAVGMLSKSFRQIYTNLSEYLAPERAFLITFRVKRGMKDTGRSGGFPKDASYLLGYKKVHEYVKAGLHLDYLYLSKVPDLTNLLCRHNLLKSDEIILPHFLQDSVPAQTPIAQDSSILKN